MKLRFCIATVECVLVGTCLALQLDHKWIFSSLILVHISMLVHSGFTNLNEPIKKITNTTDFLIDNLDGGIMLNFFMGLALMFSHALSFRLLGFGVILSGVGFLVALRHIKEFRYQIMLAKQRPIPVVKQAPVLEEVEV